jgi:hypothetical protein
MGFIIFGVLFALIGFLIIGAGRAALVPRLLSVV